MTSPAAVRRLWYPIDHSAPVSRGYLAPEPGDGGKALEDLRDTPCLVLLGAPGMGKSFEAREETRALRALGVQAELVEARRLKPAGPTLSQTLAGQAAVAWAQGEASWTLLIDGVDEYEGGASGFAAQLTTFLDRLIARGDLNRFRVRLFCRTVEWQTTVEDVLARTWPDRERETRQLAPFTREDVLATAEVDFGTQADSRSFIDAVAASRFDALASRPVSYRMLANLYGRHRSFPKVQAELFLQGLRSLLTDQRAATGDTQGADGGALSRPAALDLDRLVMLAGRIALALALSGRAMVSTTADPSEGVALADLATGMEPSPPYRFRVREADLLDVVRSPLFVATGPGLYSFAHKSFQEYLAARYLVDHELTPERLLSFLIIADPDGQGRGVAPQYREIAAWAANLSRGVFDQLVVSEPDILLQSDIASTEDVARERLTGALLDRLASGQWETGFWRLRASLSGLNHAGLADQLRDAIFNPSVGLAARLGAIDILEETVLPGFVPDLVALAADGQAHLALRRSAASAAADLAGDDERALLAPLLAADPENLDDELRGSVLTATWPDTINVRSLLTVLTPPKEPSYIGRYATFLYTFDPGVLSADDALAVLAWLEDAVLRRAEDEDPSDRGVRRKLLWAAAEQIGDARVRDAFAQLIIASFKSHQTRLFDMDGRGEPTPIIGSTQDRVALLQKVLEIAEDPVIASRYLLHFAKPIVVESDWPVLAERLGGVAAGLKPALAGLVVFLPDQDRFQDLGDLWDIAEADPVVMKAWLERYSVDLDSPSVKWMRDAEVRRSTSEEREGSQVELRDRADAAVRALLSRIDDDPEVWWQINLQLFVSRGGRYQPELEFQSDLTAAPGWSRQSPEVQAKLISAAETYLSRARLHTLRWLGTNTQHRPAAAAYRAARLLFEHRRPAFDSLDDTVWRRWAPAILSFFDNAPDAVVSAQTPIMARAYAAAPDIVLRSLVRLAGGPNSQGIEDRVLQVLDTAFDVRLGEFLMRLKDRPLKGDRSQGRIVAFLVKRHFAPAVADALDGLDRRLNGTAPAPMDDRDAGSVAQLLATGDNDVWKRVTGLTPQDPEAAKAIWGTTASAFAFGRVPNLDQINATLIADACLALDTLYPDRPEETEGARFLTAVDKVDRLRSALVSDLVRRGTGEAVVALERLAAAAIDGANIRARIPEARQAYRASVAQQDPLKTLEAIAVLGPQYPEQDLVEAAGERLLANPATAAPEVPTEADNLPLPKAKPTTAPLDILAVATEWRSGHGGISTLNRDLCIALAAQGHTVRCFVETATEDEAAHAATFGVRLIGCPEATGIRGPERFLLQNNDAFDPAPDVVIGHDHITGPYALRIAKALHRKYVHILHTVPEEIEPLKGRTRERRDAFFRGADKREDQNEMCSAADLVVGVGPRIFAKRPFGRGAPAHQLNPGLNTDLLDHKPVRPINGACLITGRMEDGDLKGLRVAVTAVWSLRTPRSTAKEPPAPQLVVRGLDDHHGETELEKFCGLLPDQHRGWLMPRRYTADATRIHDDLRQSSLVLMPSQVEGFGLTAFEAIAAGVPVLITEESGLAQLLIDFEADGVIDVGFVEAHIVIAGPDADAMRERWASRIKALHDDGEHAFKRALALRGQLASVLTWDRAASALVDEIRALP